MMKRAARTFEIVTSGGTRIDHERVGWNARDALRDFLTGLGAREQEVVWLGPARAAYRGAHFEAREVAS